MQLFNQIISTLFLIQTFHGSGVYARYPFLAGQVLKYVVPVNETETDHVIDKCASLTWIPLGVRDDESCTKSNKDFLAEEVGESEKRLFDDCLGVTYNANNFTIMNTTFDNQTLHDKVTLCGQSKNACDDGFLNEILIDKVWENAIASNTRTFNPDTYQSLDHAQYSVTPFSSRIDIQQYVFEDEEKHRNRKIIDDGQYCVDRFGRKYPPPIELGGCVMFEHESVTSNDTVTELFMPIERRDFVQRLSKYSHDNPIRDDSKIMKRLLPENNSTEHHDCLSMHTESEMFVHCVYNASESSMFLANGSTQFYCPKGDSVNQYYEQSQPPNYGTRERLHTISRSINASSFSENCYISFNFTPFVTPSTINVSMRIQVVGPSFCSSNHLVNNVYSDDDISKVIKNSLMDGCQWDLKNSTTVCVRTTSGHFYKDYVKILNELPWIPIFDRCYFQNPISDNCYYEYDITNAKVLRFPPKLISKLENDDFISTRNTWKNKRDFGCGFIYLTKEDKQECLKELKNNRKVDGFSIANLKHEYSKSSKTLVCSCHGSSCGAPDSVPQNLDQLVQDLVCNKGTSDTDVVPKPSDFFCLVELSIEPHGHQKLKKYNFNMYHHSIDNNNESCPVLSDLKMSLKPDADKTYIKGCWQHTGNNKKYSCCCRTSSEPCNTQEIIDAFYNIETDAVNEIQSRIAYGCDFQKAPNDDDVETCKKPRIRHNDLMRCYGVFQFTDSNPTLLKENCYWPHPQHHDEYSIFCSKTFMEDPEIVEQHCLQLFVQDYTHLEKKAFDRTLILCCYAGNYYRSARDSILKRSLTLL